MNWRKKFFYDAIIGKGIHYSSRIMQRDDNCLLIYGQRARVGVPGATKYGLTKDEMDAVKTAFENREDNKEKKKTVPDKPYLRMKREPVLLIYLIKIDKEIKQSRVNNSDKESIKLVDDFPVVGLGLGFPGSYEGASAESTKVKYVLNRVGERDLLNFEEDTEDEDE